MRIVVGWHSCMEAIKVRPQEIARVYLEEVKLKSAVEASAKDRNKFANKNRNNKGHNSQSGDKGHGIKSGSRENSNESLNPNDKFDFLNHKLLKNKIQYKAKSFFEKWGTGHQGIALEIDSDEPLMDFEKLNNKKSVLVALDEVEDPTNLGNLLRTSWLMGVDGLLITQDRSVKLTPQVCKIASGGAEHVPVDVVHPLSNTLEDYKKQGFWVYGLDANAEQTIYDVQFPDKVILVAGNEGKGLRKTTLNVCDQVLKIPQVSDVASLNVATSLAITLSQVQRAFLSVDENKLKK
jgi:23S rRNA (guanosine2251-2'-O)-methyltransferase